VSRRSEVVDSRVGEVSSMEAVVEGLEAVGDPEEKGFVGKAAG
jgi:hypothetical protein